MRRGIRKYLSIFLVVLIAVSYGVIFTGCNKDKEAYGEDEELAVTVEVIEASRETIKDFVRLTGRVEAEDDVKVTSKIGGRIAEIKKDVGDFVRKGEVIFTLETSELQNQLAQAQAAVSAAQANLSANESAGLPQQLEQVRASLEQAEANYTNVQADYERMKALYEQDAISKQLFDGITLKYKVAKTQYETAKEQHRLTKERLPKNVDALRAQVKQAQSTVDLIQTNIQNSVIHSPVTGIVANKLANSGEVIGAGQPIITVVNIDKINVVIDVTEEEINKVRDGQEVDVKVNSLGEDKFKGTISIIPPASNQTRLFQVKVSINNKDHVLKPGMFAEVDVQTGIKENTVVIPKDAILLKKNGNVVYLVKDGKAVEKMIKLGVTNGEKVEVIEGVEQGDQIVIKNQNLLKEGAKVTF